MGRPLTRGSDWPAPLPNTLTNLPVGKGYYPNAVTTPPHKRGGSLAPGERGTGLFCFVQIEIGAHGLNHTTQGLKGVTQRCVCDELVPDSDVLMYVCVHGRRAWGLPPSLSTGLADDCSVAATIRAWSYLGTPHWLVGRP